MPQRKRFVLRDILFSILIIQGILLIPSIAWKHQAMRADFIEIMGVDPPKNALERKWLDPFVEMRLIGFAREYVELSERQENNPRVVDGARSTLLLACRTARYFGFKEKPWEE